MSLSAEDRAALRAFLEERFNLTELKNIAFDMGIWYEVFAHNTLPDFSRELLVFCIRRGLENCLLDKLRQLRSNENWLITLATRLPPCDNVQKVQIIVDKTLLSSMQLFLDDLARRLNIPPDAITLVAAAWGSTRLLLNLPTTALTPKYKQITSLVDGRYHILSIEAYIFLPANAQEIWRQIATTSPPVLKDNILYATIGWQTAQAIIGGPEVETAVPPTVPSSNHWLSRADNQSHLLSMSRDLIGKLAPGETSRLESLFPQYTQLAQMGQVTTVQQTQSAFGLSGSIDSLLLLLLPVLFTTLNAWVSLRNRQALTELRLRQEADRKILDRLLDDALRRNHVSRSERERLRPYLTEAIAKEIGDLYSPYELGLEKLAQQVDPILERLTYEQQLRENISQARRYGDTSDRASRRSEIIEQLNRVSLRETNQTFNDLCEIDSKDHQMWPESSQSNPGVTAKEIKTQQKDRSEKSRFGHRWSSLRRLFTRKPAARTIEPVYVSPQHSAFIESIAQLIVTQVAPEELPVFEKLTAIYFADPTPPDLTAVPQYDPLSMGLGEVLVAVTPAATAVAVLALTYLSRHRPASAAEWEAQQAELHQSFNYEIGLQHLLNRIPEQHPKHSELLVFQVRLTENMAQQRLYGDTAELRHSRFQIIEQLNRLALEAVGESFNALSGMAGGISQARWQELRQQGFQVAQEFGMTEAAAEQIMNTMMSAFLTALWSEPGG